MSLPDWAPSLRPLQASAIDEITQAIQSTPVVIYEAPTGSGKTLIAEMVRQSLAAKAVYLCSSLSLQDQFMRDFPYAATIKGRSNYPTFNEPAKYNAHNPAFGLSAADCVKRKEWDEETQQKVFRCPWCDPVACCPYESAKMAAIRADLVCANSYYYLYEANSAGALSKRDLVIIDEVDTLESVMMSYVQVHISQTRMRDFGLQQPDRKTVQQSWVDWAQEAVDQLNSIPLHTQQSMFSGVDLKAIKRKNRLQNLKNDLQRLTDPLYGLKSGNWIYDGREDEILFRPITVGPYAQNYLWKHSKKWLLMSATVISQMEIAMSLGLDQ